MVEMKDGEKVYLVLERLSETIGDGMYSGEEVRRHIMKQADNLRDELDIAYLKRVSR